MLVHDTTAEVKVRLARLGADFAVLMIQVIGIEVMGNAQWGSVVRCLVRPSAASIGITFVLAVSLAGAFFQPGTALSQSVNRAEFKIEAIHTGTNPEVYEGAQAEFLLTMTSDTTNIVTVDVVVWEPNRDGADNPTLRTLQFTFKRNSEGRTRRIRALAYVDDVIQIGLPNTLKAKIVPSFAYDVYSGQGEASFNILDAEGTLPVITVESVFSLPINEGGTSAFTLTRTGTSASPLTVRIEVEDPNGFTRGNHWNPAPVLPTTAEFIRGSATADVQVQIPNDQRDVPDAEVWLKVSPGDGYLLGQIGLETKASTTVSDNDTSQDLELNFGKNGVNDADAAEGDILKFNVKRLTDDIVRRRARFTVRVETDRSEADLVLKGWAADTATDRLFKDYNLVICCGQTEVEQSITVTENGVAEDDWNYWASIRPMEDVDGNALDSAVEAQYWTVKTGFREIDVTATDTGETTAAIEIDTAQTTVYEGQKVTYTITRVGGAIGEELTVVLDTYEAGRYNSTLTEHRVTFPPWRHSLDLIVLAPVDDDSEPGTNTFAAELRCVNSLPYNCGTKWYVDIEIDDAPQSGQFVSVSARATSIVEGGYTTLTFTRTGGSTTQDLAVALRVDDREDRLRGNHWDPAPEIPTQLVIPAGSTTAAITLTFPDDQRDLPSAGLVVVSILPSNSYFLDNTGTSVALGITDNDDAQELNLEWGLIDSNDPNWNPGESYILDCAGNSCPGPAEGVYYYENDRDFDFTEEIEPYFPAHFQVTRGASDVGKTATFIVRVEHDRGWVSPRHADWPIDPAAGKHYFDFPLTPHREPADRRRPRRSPG